MDKEDYLIVKSYGKVQYKVSGKQHSKYGPLYIHFKNECWKEYARRIHNKVYDTFPYNLIKIDSDFLSKIPDNVLANLIDRGIELQK